MLNRRSCGQSMIEALFVVVFTTIIMFAFLQVCIMAVDDMTANEAAFVGMRSAAVTIKTHRQDEAKKRVEKYFNIFYFSIFNPIGSIWNGPKIPDSPGSFKYSDKQTVKPYFIPNSSSGNSGNEEEQSGSEREDKNSFVTAWHDTNERYISTDYSNYYKVQACTVKIYYFTRVMFGSLVASRTSNAKRKTINDFITIGKDRAFGISGNRRYQSARSRMISSPDSKYYYKAYPGAKKFDED